MFAYYHYSHDPALPTKADQVFPYFVSTRLPPGVAGLLLAALLAATGIPAGINTLASVLTLDFHARIDRNMSPAKQVWWGRVYSLAIGLAATLAAGVVSKLGTLFELSQIILGVFAGPLLSCIVIAVANWRCSGRAMITGLLLGWLAGIAVTQSHIAALWVAPTAAFTTLLTALLISRFDPRSRQPKEREVEEPRAVRESVVALTD
jgi:Na+/proline symporter